MTSLSKVIGEPSIDVNELLNIVDEEDILAYYFNITRIPCCILSPFREDRNPSFSISYSREGKLLWYDFGTGEGGTIIGMVSKLFNQSYEDTVSRIYQEMCAPQIVRTFKKTKREKKTIIGKVKFQVKVRQIRQYDIEYWESYGISQEWLRFGRVFPISDIFIYKQDDKFNFPADKYAYCFVEFKDDKQSLKIYQPYSERFKWMNDGDNSVWNLWSQLPEKADKLIITSSLKDALCLWANLGIPSCCLQSEKATPKKQVIEELKSRFKTVYVFYDNDYTRLENTGQKSANLLVKKYNLKNLCIDDWYESKDPSDLYKKYGKTTFQKIIRKML